MNNFSSLIKLLLADRMGIFRIKSKIKLTAIILVVVVAMYIIGLFIGLLLTNFVIAGLVIDDDLLSFLIFLLFAILLILTTGKVISNFYLSKDNTILMTMPVSHNSVFSAKLITAFISEMVYSSLLILPIMFFYIGGRLNVAYLINLPLFLLLFNALMLSLAAVLSVPIMWLVHFLKNKKKIVFGLVLIISGFGLYLYGAFIANISEVISKGQDITNIVAQLNIFLNKFGASMKITKFIASQTGKFSFLYTVAPVSLGIAAVFVLIIMLLVRRYYFKLAMLNSETSYSEKKSKDIITSPFKSLVIKEFLCVLRSPSYIFQYFLFAFLMPIVTVMYDNLLLPLHVGQIGKTVLGGAHVLIVAMMAMLSCIISGNAISLEGANFYLMKTAPLSFAKQVVSKVVFNAAITLSMIALTAVTTIIFTDISIFVIIMTSLTVAVASIGCICWNLERDVRNPSLDWFDSSEISTLNGNIKKAILTAMFASLFMGLVVTIFSGAGIYVCFSLLFVLSVLFALFRCYTLYLRCEICKDKIVI